MVGPFTMKNLTRLAFRRARREKIMGKFAKGSRESSRTTHRNVAWKLKHFRFEEKLRLPSAILLDERLNRGNKIGFTKDHELKCLGEGDKNLSPFGKKTRIEASSPRNLTR